MRRTWFWSLAIFLSPAAAYAQYGAPLQPAPATAAPATAAPAPATAAPVAAPPPVGSDPYAGGAAVAVDPSAAAVTGEKRGLQFAARLILIDTQISYREARDAVPDDLGGSLDHLPRFYGGYRMGKLGILVGLNLVNTSVADEGGAGGDNLEQATLGWSIAPGVTYELIVSATGNASLELFGSVIYGQSSFGFTEGDAEGEYAYGTTAVDLGARINAWVFPALSLGMDIGLTYANTTGELAGNDAAAIDDGANQRAFQTIAIYGALQLTTIFLQ